MNHTKVGTINTLQVLETGQMGALITGVPHLMNSTCSLFFPADSLCSCSFPLQEKKPKEGTVELPE